MFLLKPRYIVTLAIVMGMLASYGVYRYFKQQELMTRNSDLETRRVVVAVENLSSGMVLHSTDFEIREWPASLLPEGTIEEVGGLDGRVITTDLVAGEAILSTKLAPEGTQGGLASLIPPGMRALTVAVDAVSGAAGFVLPKTRVDVVVTMPIPGGVQETRSKMVLQNVEVLAVDQTYRKDGNEPKAVKSVTLLVSPQDAEKLALVANEGKLNLALRNDTDSELYVTTGQRIAQLLNIPETVKAAHVPRQPAVAKPKVEAPPPHVVEVLRGNEKSEVTFEE
jgi:pilus assembly protein CpaB